MGQNPGSFVDPLGLEVWMGEKSIDADFTGLGGHTWIIIQPDNPQEFADAGYNLPLDQHGRMALRAGQTKVLFAQVKGVWFPRLGGIRLRNGGGCMILIPLSIRIVACIVMIQDLS